MAKATQPKKKMRSIREAECGTLLPCLTAGSPVAVHVHTDTTQTSYATTVLLLPIAATLVSAVQAVVVLANWLME